jgi:hypothetical protein
MFFCFMGIATAAFRAAARHLQGFSNVQSGLSARFCKLRYLPTAAIGVDRSEGPEPALSEKTLQCRNWDYGHKE